MGANRSFYAAFALLVLGVSAAILVLSVLVTTSGPRVRHVVLASGDNDRASTVDQSLTLVFDRPVAEADFEEAIKVRPEARFSVSHREAQVGISFEENLRSGTEYRLALRPVVEDAAGRRMGRGYEHRFATAEPSFTYLERNYGRGRMDRIVAREPLAKESQTLYEATQIEAFARTKGHLAVVLPRTRYTDELRLVDLEGGGSSEAPVPGDVAVRSLEASPVGEGFAFVTRVVAGPGADDSFRRGYDGRLYTLDAATGRPQPVDTLSAEGNVEDVVYSRDGQAFLYRTFDGAYYLTGAGGGSRPTPLGNHEDTGGFDAGGIRLVFRTRDGAAVFDARTRKLERLPFGDALRGGSTPSFLHNSGALVYREGAQSAGGDGGPVSRVSVVGPDGEREARIESPDGAYFFDEPAVSHDDRHLLVESAPVTATMDYYPTNPQPEGARIVLYDLSSGRLLDEVRGLDPVWNR